MPQKWNLQDIRPSAPKSSKQKAAPKPPAPDPDLGSIDFRDGKTVKRKRMTLTSVIVLALLAFGFFANVLLGGAEVTVYPKMKDVVVQSDIVARTVPQAGDLSYEVLSLESTAEKQVKATGKEEVAEHATGKITVYNTRTGASQRLITNTRFESPDGLIFRIKSSIEIPAATEDADGNVVPGKVQADVFSDGTGEEYNIAPARFTVPGLKGSDQYDTVYAESTSAFSGGFEGERYLVEDAELAAAQEELHGELRAKLLGELKEKIPAGFIAYDDAVTFMFESLPATEYGDSLATIRERARLQVPVFKADAFAQYIAEKTIPEYAGEPVYVLDPSALSFAYAEELAPGTDIKQVTEIPFKLEGNAKIVWQFDADALKKSLAGKKKNETASVFASYRSIGNAQAEVKPFWASKFPTDTAEIEVETVIK